MTQEYLERITNACDALSVEVRLQAYNIILKKGKITTEELKEELKKEGVGENIYNLDLHLHKLWMKRIIDMKPIGDKNFILKPLLRIRVEVEEIK